MLTYIALLHLSLQMKVFLYVLLLLSTSLEKTRPFSNVSCVDHAVFQGSLSFLRDPLLFLVLLDSLANTVNSLMFTGNPILFSRGIIVLTASGLVHTLTYATKNWLIKSYKMLLNEENFQHLLFKFKPKIIHTC